MSSQSEDDQQNERDQSNQNHNHNSNLLSDANYNNNQPPQPPASHHHQPPAPPRQTNNQPSSPHGYPPAMGYPPQMMYPNSGQYPIGYNPPPPPHGYNNYYPYVQAPPGASYYNIQRYPIPQPDTCKKIARALLAVIITIIALTFLSWLLTYAIFGDKDPVFYVDNMSVSNFNTSTPFTATWNTTLTVENRNQKLNVYLDRISCGVYYDDIRLNKLAVSWLNPVFMNTKSNKTMNAVISANGSAENAVPIWVAEDMSRDRDKGSVTFILDLQILATVKYGSWYTDPSVIAVSCKDLKVDFAGGSANGVLEPGKHHCARYL